MNTFQNVLGCLATPREPHWTRTVRNFPRAPVAVRVILQSVDQHRLEGITADIGGGGLFIEHRTLLQIGTELAISLYLPDDLSTPIRSIGQVIWVRRTRPGGPSAGMGIAFTGISEPARDRLLCFIHTLEEMRFADNRLEKISNGNQN